MYSRISGLELCLSIRCENFRREYFMCENFRCEIRHEKVGQNGPFYTTYTFKIISATS